MILEGVVTTVSADGRINVAPMGPRVDPPMERFVLRPFRTAQTYRNLKDHPEGVFHVTDDVELLARAALGPVDPPLAPAGTVRGWVLRDACRYYEFRVRAVDDRDERAAIECAVRAAGRIRDFFGFNRAKHAVLEATILATRTDFLPLEGIRADLERFRVIVDKTGGAAEHRAFEFVWGFIEGIARERGMMGDEPL